MHEDIIYVFAAYKVKVFLESFRILFQFDCRPSVRFICGRKKSIQGSLLQVPLGQTRRCCFYKPIIMLGIHAIMAQQCKHYQLQPLSSARCSNSSVCGPMAIIFEKERPWLGWLKKACNAPRQLNQLYTQMCLLKLSGWITVDLYKKLLPLTILKLHSFLTGDWNQWKVM